MFFPFGAAGYALCLLTGAAGLAAAFFIHPPSGGKPGEPALAPLDFALWAGAGIYILLFWEKVFFRGWIPANSLVLSFFHPVAALMNEFFHNGSMPLWNPWSNCGMPMAADPLVGAFYPLNLPLYVFSFAAGFKIWLFVHEMLLFLWTYLWLKDKGSSAGAAFLGGILASCNAFTAWHMGYMAHFATLAWTPLLLYAFEKKSWPLLSAAAALQILAGHAQFVYMTWLMVAVLAAFEGFSWSRWAKTACSLAGGAVLAAVQILPTLELAALSTRSGPLPYDFAVRLSQPIRQLAGFIFIPQWTRWNFGISGDPHIVGFYAGPAAVLLGCLAFKAKSLRRTAPWAALSAAGFVLALGGHTPLYGALFKFVPGFNLFRFPAQWTWILFWGLCLLACHGLDGLTARWKLFFSALAMLDLCLFQLKSPYLYIDPSFLSRRTPLVEKILESKGRYMETRNVSLWKYGPVPGPEAASAPASVWLAEKDVSLISQGFPYHVPEALSITNHIPQNVNRLASLSFESSREGKEALKKMGVRWLLDVRDPKAASPDFKVLEFPEGHPFWRDGEDRPLEAKVLFKSPSSCEIELAPRAAPREIVMGETYFPGWKAFVDGKPRPIREVETAFRGVALLKGETRVFFRYDPAPFLIGLLISFLAGLAMAVQIARKGRFAAPAAPFGILAMGAGALFLAKAFCDARWGAPDANLFSAKPWEFIPRKNFIYFCQAQALFGLLCAALGGMWHVKRQKRRDPY